MAEQAGNAMIYARSNEADNRILDAYTLCSLYNITCTTAQINDSIIRHKTLYSISFIRVLAVPVRRHLKWGMYGGCRAKLRQRRDCQPNIPEHRHPSMFSVILSVLHPHHCHFRYFVLSHHAHPLGDTEYLAPTI